MYLISFFNYLISTLYRFFLVIMHFIDAFILILNNYLIHLIYAFNYLFDFYKFLLSISSSFYYRYVFNFYVVFLSL